MISFTHSGNFDKTFKFLNFGKNARIMGILESYGRKGVDALRAATPVDSGKTAASWGYQIHRSGDTYKIVWTNSNFNNGVPIAILIQYGHGTRNGGYVSGIDYINPPMSRIFEQMADELWREVTGK